MIKEIAKSVWELIVVGAAVYWVGIMLTLGAIAACDYMGVAIAIGYNEESKEQ